MRYLATTQRSPAIWRTSPTSARNEYSLMMRPTPSRVEASAAVTWLLVVLVAACGALAVAEPASSADQPFLGRWDLTLKTPTRPYPSWLELYEAQGQLKANMVGRWGNARPLPQVAISHGALTFTSPKDEENRSTDRLFKARLVGGKLVGGKLGGTTTGPDGA